MSKKNDKEQNKEKKFLQMPTFPGGNQSLKNFVNSSLRYPAEAAKKRIEGTVVIGYDVDHMGIVSNLSVIKGIGYGCDEEALRIVRLLQYNPTYNRGIRVKKTMKLRIDFRLQQEVSGFHYQIVEKPNPAKTQAPIEKTQVTYTYSIPASSSS